MGEFSGNLARMQQKKEAYLVEQISRKRKEIDDKGGVLHGVRVELLVLRSKYDFWKLS